ncbi:MAG: response regulator [Opitutaceae bacterium]
MNILVVDDHPTNLKLLRAQLEAEGMNVLEAHDGKEALATLEREPVDAVISDVLMPTMDGYQLCHAMRQTERFENTPCILYSNTFASESNRELGLEFGADMFLKKPAPVETILAALDKLIGKNGRPANAVVSVDLLKGTKPYSEHLIRDLERQNAGNEETKQRLLTTNHKLLSRTKKLEKIEAELREVNEQLEGRVTERTAELETANQELESFSYSVSHDLRAPLRAIQGFSQLVLDKTPGQLDESSRSDLDRVITAAGDMTELIDALLSLAKVSGADLDRRPVNLSATAQTVFDALAQAGPSGRATEIAIQPDVVAHADVRLLRIVLTNLLGNAWKFTRGTARPRIEFGADDSDGQRTYFVRDNGAGFDMTYAGKLFGVFHRLHSATEFEGTGIGLATVQRIIRRHGGRIWAESAPARGATFYFTLGATPPGSGTAARSATLVNPIAPPTPFPRAKP